MSLSRMLVLIVTIVKSKTNVGLEDIFLSEILKKY